MGYSNRYLTTVVLQQSVLLALVGYIPSLAISRVLYWFVDTQSGMPMYMTPRIMITVLLLAHRHLCHLRHGSTSQTLPSRPR